LSRIVTKGVTPCVHCGKPVPVDNIDGEALSDLIKDSFKPQAPVDLSSLSRQLEDMGHLTVDMGPVIEEIRTIKRPTVMSCKEHPELCEHKVELDTLKEQLHEAESQHDVLTTEYIQSRADSCPNCKKGVTDYVESEIKKRGLVAPVTTPEVKPEDDDTPAWRR
jgi:hypothetical protein